MKKKYIIVFLLSFFVTATFALVTDHRWEDWYITYRASKNLAIGNGLTFTKGERVHSFTSPINTLLPAAFAYVFDSNPDEYAVWLYRFVNALVIGFCGVLLIRISSLLKLSEIAGYFLLALFLTNTLIIDNSINGMEAPYMILFLLILIENLFKHENSSKAGYIIAFTGLMYTRPDGFIYAGSLITGYFAFHTNFRDLSSQWPQVKKIFWAVSLSILLYAPWTVLTWIYYGSPIPHTIIAKGNIKTYDLLYILQNFLLFPYKVLTKQSSIVQLFTPAYAYFGGWHKMHIPGMVVSIISALIFFIPVFPRAARSLSSSIYLCDFYLTYISGQEGMPWYLPNIIIQVIIAAAITFHYLSLQFNSKMVSAAAMTFIAFNIAVISLGAYEMRIQQKVIEYGNRKKIGLWLKSHSKSEKSTVFMECLGYIGYFSQLKTYDYPGMSSPEVVKTIKELKGKNNYANIIDKLSPEWLVLRPEECIKVNADLPDLLLSKYILVKTFDVRQDIPKNWYLFGKEYLYFDALFYVYQRKKL